MSTVQYTPGPWTARASQGSVDWGIIAQDPKAKGGWAVIAEVFSEIRRAGELAPEAVHTAHLIAAAPELLAALQALVVYDSHETEYDGRVLLICPDCGKQDGEHTAECEFVLARALIAKVTGSAA